MNTGITGEIAHIAAASPPDTSLGPPREAEEVRSWRKWGLDALLTGPAGRPVTAAQPRAARITGGERPRRADIGATTNKHAEIARDDRNGHRCPMRIQRRRPH